MTNDRITIKNWQNLGDIVKLVYEDDTVLYVSKVDFDRSFGPIVSGDKNQVLRDFAIKTDAATNDNMDINTALDILDIVKCDNLGYCRDLSKNPTKNEIGQAIEVVGNYIIKLQNQLLESR